MFFLLHSLHHTFIHLHPNNNINNHNRTEYISHNIAPSCFKSFSLDYPVVFFYALVHMCLTAFLLTFPLQPNQASYKNALTLHLTFILLNPFPMCSITSIICNNTEIHTFSYTYIHNMYPFFYQNNPPPLQKPKQQPASHK